MNGFLVLESGAVFSGCWRGGENRAGEIVFNTSHSGYEEIATDPSYYNQIMVMTAPMQGNYGVDAQFWESADFWIRGFVALQIQSSHRDRQWIERLAQRGIPLIDELDTRSAVLQLRQQGTPWGALVKAENEEMAQKLAAELIAKVRDEEKDWAHKVSVEANTLIEGQQPDGPKVVILDFGCKQNIVRELSKRCSQLIRVNSRASAEEIMALKPDGLFLSNGPGDPEDVVQARQTVAELLGQLPIFGICMGHQILALALGGSTFKLKFGHRGSNHPIKDSLLERIYMTSQNHGYAVKSDSLPDDIEVTHVNLNDDTISGLRCDAKKCFSVQFHPECHPGPRDSLMLFDKFIDLINSQGKK